MDFVLGVKVFDRLTWDSFWKREVIFLLFIRWTTLFINIINTYYFLKMGLIDFFESRKYFRLFIVIYYFVNLSMKWFWWIVYTYTFIRIMFTFKFSVTLQRNMCNLIDFIFFLTVMVQDPCYPLLALLLWPDPSEILWYKWNLLSSSYRKVKFVCK